MWFGEPGLLPVGRRTRAPHERLGRRRPDHGRAPAGHALRGGRRPLPGDGAGSCGARRDRVPGGHRASTSSTWRPRRSGASTCRFPGALAGAEAAAHRRVQGRERVADLADRQARRRVRAGRRVDVARARRAPRATSPAPAASRSAIRPGAPTAGGSRTSPTPRASTSSTSPRADGKGETKQLTSGQPGLLLQADVGAGLQAHRVHRQGRRAVRPRPRVRRRPSASTTTRRSSRTAWSGRAGRATAGGWRTHVPGTGAQPLDPPVEPGDRRSRCRSRATCSHDHAPAFDRDGKRLFFASGRSWSPQYADQDDTFIYGATETLLVVPLTADEPSPFAAKSDEEAVDGDEAQVQTTRTNRSRRWANPLRPRPTTACRVPGREQPATRTSWGRAACASP